MLDPRSEIYPTIQYRSIHPSDLEVIENIHLALFPIRYEREFFLNVVNGHGIVSWGAVDTSRSDDCRDELIGFVTTRMIPAQDSEIEDLFRYNSSRKDLTLVYILTLGVVDRYRNLGIASSLVREKASTVLLYKRAALRLIPVCVLCQWGAFTLLTTGFSEDGGCEILEQRGKKYSQIVQILLKNRSSLRCCICLIRYQTRTETGRKHQTPTRIESEALRRLWRLLRQ
ncbi:hypothetical protein GUJ93_ZPchr0006g41168 [Zizania palustris]|uniref:histone acetyltransferase n=1 Tax=Zizania palustris TaxID=103762 RepID=A0A8J5SBW4_ZIZPA|nr:hypothetical protein GUJ93_ZPchr0006g41168 [Zizania palustris]